MSSIASQLLTMQNTTTQTEAEKAKKTGATKDLGQDAFMKLMLEQLKHQDPTSPMDNKEFLAQQAQFTQLNEIQKMNTTMTSLNNSLATNNQIMQASSLIGKEVSIIDPEDEENKITGTVTSANFSGSTATVVVNGKDYPLGYVYAVSNPTSPPASTGDSAATNTTGDNT